MPRVSQAELARERNVSPSAINQRKKAGDLVFDSEGKIDLEHANQILGGKSNSKGGYLKAKAFRETFLAKKAKLDYDRLAGTTIDTEQARHAVERLAELFVRELQQIVAQADVIVAAGVRDGTKGARKKMQELVTEIRDTLYGNLTLEANDDDAD